jgi:hypothetical protein
MHFPAQATTNTRVHITLADRQAHALPTIA